MSRACLPLLLVLLLVPGGAGPAAALIAPDPPTAEVPGAPAPGMFLVASRSFHDPNFSATVIYLLKHDDQGSLGVIVNHPTPGRLTEWLPELEGTALAPVAVYAGGPVDPGYLAVVVESRSREQQYDPGLAGPVSGNIFASYDRDIFAWLLQQDAASLGRMRCYFGHVGWYLGQLEQELKHHYWHLLQGDVDEVFGDDAGTLWQRLIERLEPAEPYLGPPVS